LTGRLEGRVAFVTGAARAQGRAHCVRLAEEGANVIAIDICGPVETSKIEPATPEDLDETVVLVEKTGRQIVAHRADVRDFDAVKAAVDEGVDRWGRLDVVVANAGIVTAGLTWELTEAQWQTMIDVNLTGVWHTVKAAVPHMIAAGNGGSIVFTSSVAGYRGLVYEAHYTSAKHGIVGLSKVLALEVGEHNIRVNTIHPNGVGTLMSTEPDLMPALQANPRAMHVLATAMPTGSQSPDDVAATVAWLASDEARFITGCQLPIGSGNQLM
jgi:(+)-trans-carveol dehydrogenase